MSNQTSKGHAQPPGRMGQKAFESYVQRMVEVEWVDVDDIPIPTGKRKRHILRTAKRLGLL